MNISEVKNLVQGASYEGKIEVLEDIFQRSGDCIENGYLGSSVSSISYDEFGRLEFQSEHFENGIIVTSSGAVLDDSVIIMQVQENDNSKLLSLYSWKRDGSNYTYLALDSLSALEKAYIEIKKQCRHMPKMASLHCFKLRLYRRLTPEKGTAMKACLIANIRRQHAVPCS